MADEKGFEVVERTAAQSDNGVVDELVTAIAETHTNGKAVKVDMQGKSLINWQSTMRNRLRKLNPPLRLRYINNKAAKTVTCWAEPLEG